MCIKLKGEYNSKTLFPVDLSDALSTHQNFSPIWLVSLLVDLCTFPRSYNLFYLKRLRKRKREGESARLEESRLLFRKLLLFQALLRGALTQQSAVILVCMAIDRYVCMLHPHRYHKHSSKRVSYFAVYIHSLTIKLLTINEFLHIYSLIDTIITSLL